jgi:hypothetical protein
LAVAQPGPRRFTGRRWSLAVAIAIGVVLVAGAVLALQSGFGPGGATAETNGFTVHDVANDDISTTVISCDNGAGTTAAVTVALFDETGAPAGKRRATVEGNGTVAFATGPVPNLEPTIIETSTFRGGKASIKTSKNVDCTATLMSKAYPPTLQGALDVTPAGERNSG